MNAGKVRIFIVYVARDHAPSIVTLGQNSVKHVTHLGAGAIKTKRRAIVTDETERVSRDEQMSDCHFSLPKIVA